MPRFCPRLSSLLLALCCAASLAGDSSAGDSSSQGRAVLHLESPASHVSFRIAGAPEQLAFTIASGDHTIIESSPLAMIVDGVNLSRGVRIDSIEPYETNERYPWLGAHSSAVDRCRGARVHVTHVASGVQYTLDVRAYDDGIAFRHVVPGAGSRVADEGHRFAIPGGSAVWHHGFRGHYEGVHERSNVDDVENGAWCTLPLTIELPGDSRYACITEGALTGYSGLGLQASGNRTFTARLAHEHPVSYPFELRFGKEEAHRLSAPAKLDGEITTPWRIVMVGDSLDALANCDIVHNVCPAPDESLFPDGPHSVWLKPGRAVWKYLDGGESTLNGMKEFSRLAGELGFEYNLVEGFWRRWSASDLRELVDYSRERGVGIIVWHHSGRLHTPEERREFFDRCSAAGVAGVKIDFFDHEAKEVVDLYTTLLRDAAEHQLVIDFHGANKPTGLSRTWPNELTREAVFGLEMRRIESRAQHDVALPFTRFLAGHADYTAVHFGDRRGDTTWAHQIASAAIFTSPLLVYGAHPQRLLQNPAAEMIKSIPSVWDETIVLPQSEIGALAAFARRRGNVWFLAVLNGAEPRRIDVPLSFLKDGEYTANLVRDGQEGPESLELERRAADCEGSVTIDLAPGGGFAGRFEPRSKDLPKVAN